MHTFAYCDARFIQSVTKAAGVPPCTCLPHHTDTINPAWFESADFLYFKLHGLPGQPAWYNADYITAITAQQIRRLRLQGTIVFVANCFLWHTESAGDPRTQAPMLYALLGAGARAVVGGAGINYAKAHSVYGADVLGRAFRQHCALGFSPRPAYRLGMLRVKLHRHNRTIAMQDVQHFQLFDAGTHRPQLDGITVL